MTVADSPPDDEQEDFVEIAEDLDFRVRNPSSGYRTCPQCGRDCEPVPFAVEGKGARVSMICPLHGVHAVIDPFEGSR
jgi:hypothetical protein